MLSKPAIEGGAPVRTDDFLIFGAPDIRQEDIDVVVETLKSGWLSTGPRAKMFEEKFADYNGMRYGIGTNSCTAALHLCLEALDLPKGSEVITTDMTFCATVNSIIHAGLTPVIVDCHREDCNIDEDEIERKITPKTKAIIVVHFAGYPCNMEVINDIAKRYGLIVISDAAHAIETRYNGKSIAKFSDMTAYSFYATKNICIGEGGMVLTDNEEYANKVRIKSLHGMSKNAHLRYGAGGFKHYSVDVLGYKYNMLDITAALGLEQLLRVDKSWKRREEIWTKYLIDLQALPLYYPPIGTQTKKHGHHLFTVQINLDALNVNRDFVLSALISEGIGTGVHYNAIHTHPYYRNTFGLNAEDFPNAQWISDRTLSLPISSKLSDKDIDDVVEALTKILTYYRK